MRSRSAGCELVTTVILACCQLVELYCCCCCWLHVFLVVFRPHINDSTCVCVCVCYTLSDVLVMSLDRLTSLIPDTSRRQVALELPTREFEMAYRLDCRNLCADFCEDIEFRFSLGLSSLIRRFLGKAGVQRFAHGYTQVGVCCRRLIVAVSPSWSGLTAVKLD